MSEVSKDLQRLREYLSAIAGEGQCVAFSGGVDSAVILKAACECGGSVHALTMYTPFHSPMEPEHAAAQAREYGAHHHLLTLGEMPPAVMENPPDRCYLCKREIFTQIGQYARKQSLAYVVDGTNADDLNEYRPGLRALRELGVKSPLAELGIPKARVRELAEALGLSIAKKPSAPCLATRFPYNQTIRLEQLRELDGLESWVKTLGPQVVRARAHGNILRLEVLPEAFPALLEHREALTAQCREAGFDYVTLDLEGFRSGSMDIGKGKANAFPSEKPLFNPEAMG